jgi:lysozyme
MINGCDTSHWEGEINWANMLSKGFRFNYSKATEGLYYTDPDYKKDIQAAKAAGLLVGSYHFFRAKDDTLKQINRFCDTIAGMPMDLPPVLDVEEASPACGWANYQTAIRLALQTIEQRTGRKPMVYTSKNFWNYTNNPKWAGEYPLWVAHYTTGGIPLLPTGWSTWTMWQYSEAGKDIVNPYDGVDLNYFNGEWSDLLKFCGMAPEPLEPPVVPPVTGVEDRLPAFLKELQALLEKYG